MDRAGLTRATRFAIVATIMVASTGAGTAQPRDHGRDQDDSAGEEEIPLKTVKLLIEHNASKLDTGFQIFLDGEPWKKVEVRGPSEELILTVRPQGNLKRVGLTELFIESNEPPNDEVPIPVMLANLPEGDYQFEALGVDDVEQEGVATLSHRIPAGPEITSPRVGVMVSAERDLTIKWKAVTTAVHGGTNVTITHYQLIVNKLDQLPGPGFGTETLSIHVPASVTRMKVPAEFLQPGTSYEVEVMAIEANGNQTFTESSFSTR